MIADLIEGISIKLNSVFGDSFTIYNEAIRQGFKQPCFFIALLDASETQVIGNRYKREQPFDIHYFPESKQQPRSECLAVADKLASALELMTVGSDCYRGTKMHYEIIDEVLHFFVNYNFYVVKGSDQVHDLMATVDITTELKG